MHMTFEQYNEIICTDAFRDLIESISENVWGKYGDETGTISTLVAAMTHNAPYHLLQQCGVDQNNRIEIQTLCEYIANHGF